MSHFKRVNPSKRQTAPYLKQIIAACASIALLTVTLIAVQKTLRKSPPSEQTEQTAAAVAVENPTPNQSAINGDSSLDAKPEKSFEVFTSEPNDNPKSLADKKENSARLDQEIDNAALESETSVAQNITSTQDEREFERTQGKTSQQKSKQQRNSGEPEEETFVAKSNPVIERNSMEDDEDEPTKNRKQESSSEIARTAQPGQTIQNTNPKPVESRLIKARSLDRDLRSLPRRAPIKKGDRPEREDPPLSPGVFVPPGTAPSENEVPNESVQSPSAPAPPPITNFDGLDLENWGAGSPADPNGDAGPGYFIQTVNSSVGIYDKSNGNLVTAFTFDTLMSQGQFGNFCDDSNFGDPVVLYDSFEDRWILTDFAFRLDGSGNVSPQRAYQCFAVSKTSDPVSGGWNFYSIETVGGLGDYPKLGVWTDGLYMTASMFGYPAGASFINPRVYAFNKAQMYAGAPTVQVVSFDLPATDFTVLPSNARLQTGTPPPGTPNYYLSTWQFLNAVTVYKFKVNWDKISLSTFTGPDVPLAATSWPNASVPNAPQSGTSQLIDTLQIRAMMQNQYSNIGGAESLWITHTVRRGNTTGFAAPRWYQVNVSGGNVAPTLLQAATWDPDGSNVLYRFIPSLAVDRAGNMALGYSTSSSTTFPSIKYAGRLATDPINTFSQTEQTLFDGTASQTSSARWGDYSSMTVDPDGCTFWFTTQYANPLSQASNRRWKTRIGSFKYAECTPIGNGALQGIVTSGGNPVSGATVSIGSRNAATDANGVYSFSNLPAGTYPSVAATKAGYLSTSTNSVVVNESATATSDFTLNSAPTNDCPTDTTQSDFQSGVESNLTLNPSGDITLLQPLSTDQQNSSLGTSGVGITVTTFGGQTFTPSVNGELVKADINLFCSGCTGTTPNLTLSVRATIGGLPTGADLATATVTGFSSGSSGYHTGVFTTPLPVSAGTQYAFVIRPTTNPSPGTYALTRSGTSTLGNDSYPGGTRVAGATSGTVWSIPLTGGISTDAGFVAYINTGYSPSGTYISGLKDANPNAISTPKWGAISWNGATPANTDIKFQAAASNNPLGTFNFVGPDGTAGTFFTNGASLAQFDGFRYVRYKALLTGNSTETPTLSDATICFVNQAQTELSVGAVNGTYDGLVNLSATLTSGGAGVNGKTIDFKINNVSVGSGTTDAAGVATLSNVSLSGINSGNYPNGVSAGYGGENFFASNSAANSLIIGKADQTIMFDTLQDKMLGDLPFTVSAAGGNSGNPVTFNASGGFCTSGGTNGATITLVGVGSCTITASQVGNSNYNDAGNVVRSFDIAPRAAYTVSGKVTYGITPVGQPIQNVAGVQLASGVSNPTATTDSSGIYQMGNMLHGESYIITPSKSGDRNGITSFDAAMVLRNVAANGQAPHSLDTHQTIAADADGNSTISAFDATLILRYVAANGQNTNMGLVGDWKFDPESTSFPILNGNVSTGDFAAILVGDVDGSWIAPTQQTLGVETVPESEKSLDRQKPDLKTAAGRTKKPVGTKPPAIASTE